MCDGVNDCIDATDEIGCVIEGPKVQHLEVLGDHVNATRYGTQNIQNFLQPFWSKILFNKNWHHFVETFTYFKFNLIFTLSKKC